MTYLLVRPKSAQQPLSWTPATLTWLTIAATTCPSHGSDLTALLQSELSQTRTVAQLLRKVDSWRTAIQPSRAATRSWLVSLSAHCWLRHNDIVTGTVRHWRAMLGLITASHYKGVLYCVRLKRLSAARTSFAIALQPCCCSEEMFLNVSIAASSPSNPPACTTAMRSHGYACSSLHEHD